MPPEPGGCVEPVVLDEPVPQIRDQLDGRDDVREHGLGDEVVEVHADPARLDPLAAPRDLGAQLLGLIEVDPQQTVPVRSGARAPAARLDAEQIVEDRHDQVVVQIHPAGSTDHETDDRQPFSVAVAEDLDVRVCAPGLDGAPHEVLLMGTDDVHADRLLEAVWRESLWLVKDGIASTQEIDDAIRYGFGLRWAQMGLFETYRIAGGEAGMKHFIGQFGPALKWPWTKLMDVPELTDELVNEIASQSDAQSGAHSLRELERIRDGNLIGILQALRANNWGAGQTLREMNNRFFERAKVEAKDATPDYGKPLTLHRAEVRGDWLDYNGHMTEHRYLQVFGDATDAFLGHIGMNDAYRAQGLSVYTVETHIRHLAETAANVRLAVQTTLLGYDDKRIHLLHEMTDPAGTIQATAEHMLLHVDTRANCACPMRAPLGDKLAAMAPGQRSISHPDHAGSAIRDIGWPAKEMA